MQHGQRSKLDVDLAFLRFSGLRRGRCPLDLVTAVVPHLVLQSGAVRPPERVEFTVGQGTAAKATGDSTSDGRRSPTARNGRILGPDQVPGGFLLDRWDDHLDDLDELQQPGQMLCVLGVGLHPLTCRSLELLRRGDQALNITLTQEPGQSVPRRAGLVDHPDRAWQRRHPPVNVTRIRCQPAPVQLARTTIDRKRHHRQGRCSTAPRCQRVSGAEPHLTVYRQTEAESGLGSRANGPNRPRCSRRPQQQRCAFASALGDRDPAESVQPDRGAHPVPSSRDTTMACPNRLVALSRWPAEVPASPRPVTARAFLGRSPTRRHGRRRPDAGRSPRYGLSYLDEELLAEGGVTVNQVTVYVTDPRNGGAARRHQPRPHVTEGARWL